MANKWQMVLLGVVIAQGIGLNASENPVLHSPRKNPLGYPQDVLKIVRKMSGEFNCSFKKNQSSDNIKKDKKLYGIGLKDISDAILAESLKNDPRIGWLPI